MAEFFSFPPTAQELQNSLLLCFPKELLSTVTPLGSNGNQCSWRPPSCAPSLIPHLSCLPHSQLNSPFGWIIASSSLTQDTCAEILCEFLRFWKILYSALNFDKLAEYKNVYWKSYFPKHYQVFLHYFLSPDTITKLTAFPREISLFSSSHFQDLSSD